MDKVVKVGTCGWRGKRSNYYQTFPCIELQETFYRLPKLETLKKYRLESPKDFEFTVKAWQAITHPVNSPTWRKSKPPKWGRPENFGYLRPTEENFKAWEELIEICNALESRILIIQTPPSFTPSTNNVENMKGFLSSVKRDGLLLGWEPRGNWSEEVVADLCEKLDLIHVVDPFRRLPFRDHEIAYFRLHGIGEGETNYRYAYTQEDLKKLYEIVMKIEAQTVYVMFNNVKMLEDAAKFLEILKSKA